jgi:hypothetical protein
MAALPWSSRAPCAQRPEHPRCRVIVCLLPPPVLLFSHQADAPEAPGVRPQAREAVRVPGTPQHLVRQKPQGISRPWYLERLPGGGRREPVPGACSPTMSRTGGKPCLSLLTTSAARPASGSRPCQVPRGQQQRTRPSPHPYQPAIRAGRATNDAGGDQRTGSHSREHQPWGTPGAATNSPCQPRTASLIDVRSTLTDKHVRIPPVSVYDHTSSTAERQSDGYDRG